MARSSAMLPLLLVLAPVFGFREVKERKAGAAINQAPGRGSIGVGYDVPRSNFWSWRNNYIRQFYSDDMPDSCFAEDPCPHVIEKRSYDFSSVKEWSQHYSSTFSIELGGGYKGFKGSIGASLSKQFDNAWSNEKNVSYFYISKRQKCYQLLSECATNPDYLNPRARSLLDQLPLNGTDHTTMTVWKFAFLQQFGTHVALKSSHGALLQATASADASCKMSGSCRNAAGCLKLGFLEYISLAICANTTECKNSSSCESTFETACVAVGGDPSLSSSDLCDGASEDEVNRFLDSGDMASTSSTIGLTFRPVGEILIQMGFWQQGLLVLKADEFYTCGRPLTEWQSSNGGDHECKCVLDCQNHGILDPHSCACTCRADDDHGFTDYDCRGTFGKCVRGVGSSGTPTARGRACVEGNICGGIERSDNCGDTDVCCNRDEGGLCCPFGSTCNCFQNGGRFCQCDLPEWMR